MAYDYTIITYGGGKILTEIFNGIAAAVGSQSYLTIIGLFSFFAFTWIAIESVFKQSFHVNVKWFVGFFLLYNIMLVPKVTVHIDDIIYPDEVNIVQNVPWGLAEFSSDIFLWSSITLSNLSLCILSGIWLFKLAAFVPSSGE